MGGPLFDIIAGEERKLAGQVAAAENNARLFLIAREMAWEIVNEKGTVCLDCVMESMVAAGHDPHCLGNSAGRLLSGDRRLAHTNRTTKSKRPWANANRIGVYRRSGQ